jgi:putative tryptophan/tyrosine transport system substrate-binding protein
MQLSSPLLRTAFRALLVPADAFFAAARDRLAELAALNHVPAIYSLREFVVSGGLMSYGNDLPTLTGSSATTLPVLLKAKSPPICRTSAHKIRICTQS